MTSRDGGVSISPWTSLNLALHVGDASPAVMINRERVAVMMGMPVVYLNQVHGSGVFYADEVTCSAPSQVNTADAVWTDRANLAVCVQVADCLPVLFADRRGRAVAAAHAGWRGLQAGVLEETVRTLCLQSSCQVEQLEVWLGPCIGPTAFEVGNEVHEAFCRSNPGDTIFFKLSRSKERWLADLQGLARNRLLHLGVTRIAALPCCTWWAKKRYFSYRRDGVTGRMAAVIGLKRI